MKNYDVAAYVWPAYTGDEPRTRIFWPEGIGEWQSVKNSKPKENGYFWNRKPLWGYVNEADPSVMEMQIDEAVSHGVNVFIYDWYWYDGRPFLEQCLDNGFLRAKNNRNMKFYLMWANHDANHCWSIDLSDEYGNTVLWKGEVDRPNFEKIVCRVIEKYFVLPNYYKIDGRPVFMIYDVKNFINGLGGIENAKNALLWFREQTKAAGFPDLHLQITVWNEPEINLSGFDANMKGSTKDIVRLLRADSVTHYQFAHFAHINRDYTEILKDVAAEWKRIEKEYEAPYFPHISCGWDNNPRYKNFRPGIVKNNTPENFEKGLMMAKEYLDARPALTPLVTVNSWNEWTETSYLEPDDFYGYGYLDAVKKVFG
ncbi:MAG: glycoside hydrolase family 99-like domain-containing protein [Clostridia bacterium]|nr:glycoside hydrolase family 99-like domain-containing protein [Clostridia bacterium]